MIRSVVALAMAAITSSITPAYGADDVAQLEQLTLPWTELIYDLELAGPDRLVGRLAGRRASHAGNVDLRKEDGVWSGWWGYGLYLHTGTADAMGDGEIKVTLTSVHWGETRQFVIRLTAAGDVDVRGRGAWEGAHDAHGFLSADATTLTTGHCGRNLSSCLRFTSEAGRSYEGQRDGRQHAGSLRWRLYADGHLTPAATAREDPVLYVLLYVFLGRP